MFLGLNNQAETVFLVMHVTSLRFYVDTLK